jgi:hypothetical protein
VGISYHRKRVKASGGRAHIIYNYLKIAKIRRILTTKDTKVFVRTLLSSLCALCVLRGYFFSKIERLEGKQKAPEFLRRFINESPRFLNK